MTKLTSKIFKIQLEKWFLNDSKTIIGFVEQIKAYLLWKAFCTT